MTRMIVAAVMAVLSTILLLPVFVVAGILFLFASCVHAIGRLLEPRFVSWQKLMAFDQKLGWKPRPNLDTHYLAERDDVFRVVTDKDGWPGRRSVKDSSVVVIGDSFAFGYGVNQGSSFADLNSAPAIKAIGAPGYSMVQSVLMMEELAEQLAGKLVVWFVCLENDLEDNLAPSMFHYRSPFARPSRTGGDWEIMRAHVSPTPWQSAAFGDKRLLPYLCVPGPVADRVYTACDYLIGRGSASCLAVGAQLVLVTIPDPSQLTDAGRARLGLLSGNPEACNENLPDQRIAESCKRHGVPLIVGKDHLTARDYKRIEGLHWNQRGHRRMADVLGRVYQSYKAGELERRTATSYPVADEGLAALRSSPAGTR